MSFTKESSLCHQVAELVARAGLLSAETALGLLTGPNCQEMAADGSSRRFWRVGRAGEESWIVVAPAGVSTAERKESRAAWYIAGHLWGKGVPVPRPLAWDEESGLLLMEDLGDIRLHDLVSAQRAGTEQQAGTAKGLYRLALDQLALMQCRGAKGFDPDWCYDTPRYDLELMLARESNYFLDAFCHGFLGREIADPVREELGDIARQAAVAPAEFFLHRDFQCRNIMVKAGEVRFIDFQGGRLGPLGYDPASLLIDPYAGLSAEDQEELLSGYILSLTALCPLNEADFRRQYQLLAVQRNLQIIGAFAFLSQVRGKAFFLAYLPPAVDSLVERLGDPSFSGYRALRSLVATTRADLARR